MVDKAETDLKEATNDAADADNSAPANDGGDSGKQGTGGKTALSGSVLDIQDEPGDEGIDTDDVKAIHPAEFPDDWREKMSGGDEKALAQLKRLKSPADLYKSYRSMQQKLSSGEYTRALPEDATDEERTEWRKANGVPESAEGYKIPEVKGYEWNDADTSLINEFLTDAHAADLPQSVVDKTLRSVARLQQQQMEKIAQFDATNKERMEDELRTELGKEYRPRLLRIGRVLKDEEAFPGGIGELIAAARDPNGLRLIDNPNFFRWLDSYAELYKGESGLVSAEETSAMESEEAKLVEIMKTDRDRYFAEGLDKKLQEIRDRRASGKKR